jgi:YrbI family 3-deoxy-D-manno-octulosonate 8-phosphate phosphatase
MFPYMNQEQNCQQVELILSDVDGVLTDGSIIFDNQGIETKRFHIRDGLGIKLWQRSGFRFGIITARSSHIVKLRAAEMGVELLRQGSSDKLRTVQQILDESGFTFEQVCYIGDDLLDLSVMTHVGWPVAVADAAEEVQRVASYVTRHNGGHGAVRETVEVLLREKGLWEDLVRHFQGR